MEWWERLRVQWEMFRDDSMLMASPWLLIAGVVLLMVAAGFWWRERTWSWLEPHATATITEDTAQQDAQGNVNYFPHFRFRLPDGEIVQVVSKKGSGSPAFDAGDVVPARYSAKDPEDATIETIWRVYTASIVLGVLGTILFDMGAGYFAWRKRRIRRGPKVRVRRGFYGFR
jgi:hypothetical protein